MAKLTQEQRIKKAAKLFDQIKKLFPNTHVNLNIHDLEVDDLPKGFKLKRISWDLWVAQRKELGAVDDIVIYIKRRPFDA